MRLYLKRKQPPVMFEAFDNALRDSMKLILPMPMRFYTSDASSVICSQLCLPLFPMRIAASRSCSATRSAWGAVYEDCSRHVDTLGNGVVAAKFRVGSSTVIRTFMHFTPPLQNTVLQTIPPTSCNVQPSNQRSGTSCRTKQNSNHSLSLLCLRWSLTTQKQLAWPSFAPVPSSQQPHWPSSPPITNLQEFKDLDRNVTGCEYRLVSHGSELLLFTPSWRARLLRSHRARLSPTTWLSSHAPEAPSCIKRDTALTDSG